MGLGERGLADVPETDYRRTGACAISVLLSRKLKGEWGLVAAILIILYGWQVTVLLDCFGVNSAIITNTVHIIYSEITHVGV